MEELIKQLKDKLEKERMVTFYPIIADITGDNDAALLLAQMFFWTKNRKTRNRDGWFYKTKEEWYYESRLSRKLVDKSRKILVELGFVEERQARLEHKTYYKLDIKSIINAIDSLKNPLEIPKPLEGFRDGPVGAVVADPEGLSFYTKNTTKNTANTLTVSKPKLSVVDKKSEKVKKEYKSRNDPGEVAKVIECFAQINAIAPFRYGHMGWRRGADDLLSALKGFENVQSAIFEYVALRSVAPFMPQISTPTDMAEKLAKMQTAIHNYKNDPKNVYNQKSAKDKYADREVIVVKRKEQ